MELDPPTEQPTPPAAETQKEEQIKTSDTVEAPTTPVQKKWGKTPIQPPSPPMTCSRAAKGDIFSSGMSLNSHVSTSHSSLSSHLHHHSLVSTSPLPSTPFLVSRDLLFAPLVGQYYLSCSLPVPHPIYTTCSSSTIPISSYPLPAPLLILPRGTPLDPKPGREGWMWLAWMWISSQFHPNLQRADPLLFPKQLIRLGKRWLRENRKLLIGFLEQRMPFPLPLHEALIL